MADVNKQDAENLANVSQPSQSAPQPGQDTPQPQQNDAPDPKPVPQTDGSAPAADAPAEGQTAAPQPGQGTNMFD